jgi:hypothetical protein
MLARLVKDILNNISSTNKLKKKKSKEYSTLPSDLNNLTQQSYQKKSTVTYAFPLFPENHQQISRKDIQDDIN